MWPDRVSNPGPLTYESGALPTATNEIPYYFSYNTEFLSFQNNPKISYKMDLDLSDCLRRVKLVL